MDLRRTPFTDRHVALGARMVDFAGYLMPVQYSGIQQEHDAVRQAAGLFDVSHMGQVRFTGPKALATLQWLLSNDVSQVAIGTAQYACLCNERGGVVDDVFTYRVAQDDYLVVVNASNRAKDVAWFHAHNPNPEGCTIVDQSDDWALLAVQGPKALQALQGLVNVDLESIARRGFVSGAVDGVDGCFIARTGYTGEDGFELFIPVNLAEPLWDKILAAGAAVGMLPVGLGARDTLRLEVRNCLYGHELSDDISPLQARLNWVTKLDKSGGFVGSEAILARRDSETHFLAGLVIEGSRIGRDGMRVLADGQDIGWVTSGTRAPSLGRGVCMAYLRPPYGKPGTQVVVDVRGREAAAVIVKGPFYVKESA